MDYDKKLWIAKLLVSFGLVILMLSPLMMIFGAGHIGSPAWTPHARFHVAATSFGTVLALPIMLWAVWSKTLFGTGRSVRLMAYIGLAYVMGVFIASALQKKLALASSDAGQEITILGLEANLAVKLLTFILLVSGIVLSIRKNSEN